VPLLVSKERGTSETYLPITVMFLVFILIYSCIYVNCQESLDYYCTKYTVQYTCTLASALLSCVPLLIVCTCVY